MNLENKEFTENTSAYKQCECGRWNKTEKIDSVFGNLKIEKENKMIKLGQEVEDLVTGLRGICIAKMQHLDGLDKIVIQPKIDKFGKIEEAKCVNEIQVRIIEFTPLELIDHKVS